MVALERRGCHWGILRNGLRQLHSCTVSRLPIAPAMHTVSPLLKCRPHHSQKTQRTTRTIVAWWLAGEQTDSQLELETTCCRRTVKVVKLPDSVVKSDVKLH